MRADLGYMALEGLAGHGVYGHVGVLSVAHVDDVGLVHFYFGGDHGHIGNGHQEAAGGVLNAGDHVFSHAHGDETDHAVNGSRVGGLAQNVFCAREHGAALFVLRPRPPHLRLQLKDPGGAGVGCSDGAVVRRFARVVVGLRDQAVLIQALAALPVELGALEVGFSLRQVGLGSLVVGVGGSHPGYGGIQSSQLGLNVGARLDVFETQQDVALPDLVALLHHDFGDLADAFTKDVGVIPGLNLARGGHLRSQILRLRLAGLHRHHAFVGLLDAVEDDPAQNGCGSHANPHLFPRLHCLNSSTFS